MYVDHEIEIRMSSVYDDEFIIDKIEINTNESAAATS